MDDKYLMKLARTSGYVYRRDAGNLLFKKNTGKGSSKELTEEEFIEAQKKQCKKSDLLKVVKRDTQLTPTHKSRNQKLAKRRGRF